MSHSNDGNRIVSSRTSSPSADEEPANSMVLIGKYENEITAQLARNKLEAAGIHSFLCDEIASTQLWLLNTAPGVKLMVRQRDAENASDVLSDHEPIAEDLSPEEEMDSAADDEAENEAGVDDAASNSLDSNDEERDPTERERNASRALRGAIIGLGIWPLQLYVLWLLSNVFVSRERLDAKSRKQALIATVISLPMTLLFCLLLLTFFKFL